MTAPTPLRRAIRKVRSLGRPPVAVPPSSPPRPIDVRRAYAVLLGRGPEDADIVGLQASRYRSIEELCLSVMDSPEFRDRWRESVIDPDAIPPGRPAPPPGASDDKVIAAFAPYRGPGAAGFVTDFLGTRTRTTYVRGMPAFDGMVEGYPIPGNFHGAAVEWAGVLRAALEAGPELVAVELGAGWGPWLTAAAAAGRRCGVADIRLVGVEAAGSHVDFLRQHFADNGLAPDAHTLLHGAAGVADGFAEFPDLTDPTVDYGATLATADPLLHRVVGPATTRVPVYSLPTLLAPFDRVDLVHIDIQSSEADVLAAAREVVNAKVRRLVVGTHGRAVEQRLLEQFSADGWRLEADHPCRYAPYNGGLALAVDGCQVWRNPAV